MSPRLPKIAPAVTTAEDVRDAYNVFLGHSPNGSIVDRIRLSRRSLIELQHQVRSSSEMTTEGRRNRLSGRPLDEQIVKAAYRQVRFEEIPPDAARLRVEQGGTLLQLVDELLASAERDQLYDACRRQASSDVRVVQSKSMPRSGHHLLANMLGEYFRERLAYCEFYSASDCCRSTPCDRPLHPLLGNSFLLQKGHDEKLSDPVAGDGTYVIQYRHPITRVQSNFDHWLFVVDGEDTEASFRKFVESDMDYYAKFWRKWIQPRIIGGTLLKYEDLIGQPEDSIRRIVASLDGDKPVDDKGVQRAVDIVGVPSGSVKAPTATFVARNVYEYRYQDKAFYREVEAAVFQRCPGLDYERLYS